MRSKKKDKEKKYIAGGMFVLPAAQAALGAYQMIQGNKMASKLQEPADQMNALKSSAFGSEREINRNVAAYGRDMGAAQAAVEGGLQNISGAAGQAGLMALYGGKSSKGGNEADPLKLNTAPDIGSKEA